MYTCGQEIYVWWRTWFTICAHIYFIMMIDTLITNVSQAFARPPVLFRQRPSATVRTYEQVLYYHIVPLPALPLPGVKLGPVEREG
jgi:hypothetical protein